mmetsp:Transcript_11/g.23  ORF Transcript_11/g.23 Transcript_11/m.23 type:complete len:245 (+) Transcript_11:635-1369(+)
MPRNSKYLPTSMRMRRSTREPRDSINLGSKSMQKRCFFFLKAFLAASVGSGDVLTSDSSDVWASSRFLLPSAVFGFIVGEESPTAGTTLSALPADCVCGIVSSETCFFLVSPWSLLLFFFFFSTLLSTLKYSSSKKHSPSKQDLDSPRATNFTVFPPFGILAYCFTFAAFSAGNEFLVVEGSDESFSAVAALAASASFLASSMAFSNMASSSVRLLLLTDDLSLVPLSSLPLMSSCSIGIERVA